MFNSVGSDTKNFNYNVNVDKDQAVVVPEIFSKVEEDKQTDELWVEQSSSEDLQSTIFAKNGISSGHEHKIFFIERVEEGEKTASFARKRKAVPEKNSSCKKGKTLSQEGEYDSFFGKFPEEVILYILSFLKSEPSRDILLTNKQFNRIGFPELTPLNKANRIFFKAAEEGNLVIINKLIAREGIDLASAFKIASKNGHTEIVKSLLADKRVKDLKEFKYSSPDDFSMLIAIYETPVEGLVVLADKKKIDVDRFLRNAAIEGDLATINKLISIKSINLRNAFIGACTEGHVNIVKKLLADERLDPSIEENFPIRLAIANGYAEIVKLLLNDKRTRINSSNDLIFYVLIAMKKGHIMVLKVLVEHNLIDPSFLD